jgi:hypothetical protein
MLSLGMVWIEIRRRRIASLIKDIQRAADEADLDHRVAQGWPVVAIATLRRRATFHAEMAVSIEPKGAAINE